MFNAYSSIRYITQVRALFMLLILLFSNALSGQSNSTHTPKKNIKTPTIIVQPNGSAIHIRQSEKDTTKTAPHKTPNKKPAAITPNRLKRPGSTVIHRQGAFEKKP